MLAICTLRRRCVARVFAASRGGTATWPFLFIRVVVERVFEVLAVDGIAGVVARGQRFGAVPVEICCGGEASERQEVKWEEHDEWRKD